MKSENLTIEIQAAEKKIATVQAELDKTPRDSLSMLITYLESKLSFDFAKVQADYEAYTMGKEQELELLQNEKARLQKELEEVKFDEMLKSRRVQFSGGNVEGFEGSRVKLKCRDCGWKGEVDVKGLSGFSETVNAADQNALGFVYRYHSNRLYIPCGKCNHSLDVAVWRGS